MVFEKANAKLPVTFITLSFAFQTNKHQNVRIHFNLRSRQQISAEIPRIQVNACEAIATLEMHYPNTALSANCLRDFLKVETNIILSIIFVSQKCFVNCSLQIFLTQSRSYIDSQHQRASAPRSLCLASSVTENNIAIILCIANQPKGPNSGLNVFGIFF